MNLRIITLFSIALTLYLVGGVALKLIATLLPIPIPVECILIGLFMGMFPRRTAMIFYATTCGLLIVETLINIPNLIMIMQTTMNLGSALALNPMDVSPVIVDYSRALWIVVAISTVVVLAKYRMKAIKALFKIVLNAALIIVYTIVPFVVFIVIVIRFSGASADNLIDVFPILWTCSFVLWNIYITITGPFVARWVFNRIGIYRRIPKIFRG